jgi:cyclase
MLARRLIPCLDVAGGRVVKGVRFERLRDAGDPVAQAARYDAQGADEIVLLDITASHEERGTLLDLVARVADTLFIPFTVGGGIRSVEDATAVLRAGADKVAVNTAVVRDPDLATRLADRFGRQCVVVAIDAKARPAAEKRETGNEQRGVAGWEVFVRGGREPTGIDVVEWAGRVEQLGAGEILLTSMDADGTTSGYDLPLTGAVARAVRIPVIASGGAGRLEHLAEALDAGAHGILAATLFHDRGTTLGDARAYLSARGYPVRP